MSFSFAWAAAAEASWKLKEHIFSNQKKKIRQGNKMREKVPLQICIL
jgi:hypothetical protein